MQELIKIEKREIGLELVNSVNSRELHKALEIKKDYSNWMKQQIGTLGLEENVDYLINALKGENKTTGETRGRKSIDYIITTDTAKHISMASRTPKGKEVRRYFIEVEKRVSDVDGRLDKLELAVGVMSESMKLIAQSMKAISENIGKQTTNVMMQSPSFVTLNPQLSDNKRRKEEFIRSVIDVLAGFDEGISQSALFHRVEFSQSTHTRRWLHEGVGTFWDMYIIPGNGYRYISRGDMADINS